MMTETVSIITIDLFNPNSKINQSKSTNSVYYKTERMPAT